MKLSSWPTDSNLELIVLVYDYVRGVYCEMKEVI